MKAEMKHHLLYTTSGGQISYDVDNSIWDVYIKEWRVTIVERETSYKGPITEVTIRREDDDTILVIYEILEWKCRKEFINPNEAKKDPLSDIFDLAVAVIIEKALYNTSGFGNLAILNVNNIMKKHDVRGVHCYYALGCSYGIERKNPGEEGTCLEAVPSKTVWKPGTRELC